MDTFRVTPTELTEYQTTTVASIKEAAILLASVIQYGSDQKPSDLINTDTREKALAMTKLEEAVMWAVKGWTNPEL